MTCTQWSLGQKVRFAFSICRFWLEKAVALRAVIGTNLHGEGNRALSKRTAIVLWSSFAWGWGHNEHWGRYGQHHPSMEKRFFLIWCVTLTKRRCTICFLFALGFVCVCVFHWMSVCQGIVCSCLVFLGGFCFFVNASAVSEIGLWALSARRRWHLDLKEIWNPWSSSQGDDPEAS